MDCYYCKNCQYLSEKRVFSDGCVYQYCCFNSHFIPSHLVNDNYCTGFKISDFLNGVLDK